MQRPATDDEIVAFFCAHKRPRGAWCWECGWTAGLCPHGKYKIFCTVCQGKHLCWPGRHEEDDACEHCKANNFACGRRGAKRYRG